MGEIQLGDLRSPVGLIAGSGSLPGEFIIAAKNKGLKVVTVAHVGETEKEIEDISESCSWVKVGQLGKLIKTLHKAGVKQATFAGGICKPKLFSNLSLDFKGWLTLIKLKTSNDDTLLRGISKEIERSGIKIFSAGLLLEDSIVKNGLLTKRGLSTEEVENAKIGWQAAEAIGKCDIGQTVVVNRKSIIAVEAIEGTDACIKRAGELSGKGCVIVKLSKPGQDERFDLPAIGRTTIENMQAIGATALVLRAGGAMLLKPQEIIEAADKFNIAVDVW